MEQPQNISRSLRRAGNKLGAAAGLADADGDSGLGVQILRRLDGAVVAAAIDYDDFEGAELAWLSSPTSVPTRSLSFRTGMTTDISGRFTQVPSLIHG
jgi:hypothetical protein